MNVGIITYHSAYNYGSVLQALATQISVERLGYHAEIINYRMKSQRDFYSLYRKNYGVKTLIKDILLTPHNSERRIHDVRFENVINTMNLTEEYVEPDDVSRCEKDFDCFISGSDQIWNKRSCELTPVGWEYMNPYLLDFTNKKKISYASSIASMTDDEIDRIIPYIDRFDSLSFREKVTAQKIAKRINKSVATVLDPTLLLDIDKWAELLELKSDDKDVEYILYYSLAGYKDVKCYLKKLEKIAKEANMVVYAITPFISFLNTKYVTHIYDAGPIEFLKYIMGASLIVTDSYHGTLFSINFNKLFYSITDGSSSHMRKNQILEELDLLDRIAVTDDDIALNYGKSIDYSIVNRKVQALRDKSNNYLKTSLE